MNKIVLSLMLSAIYCASSNSAGYPASFIVSNGETIIASAVVTDTPYLADNTGKSDATTAIQKAIDDTALLGGGVVYLPAGRYRIDGSLKLKYATGIAGEWIDPNKGGIGKGTILLAYGSKRNPDGESLIQAVSTESVILNLNIYYPEQKPENIIPYPPTISLYMTTISNITFYNAYSAIDIPFGNANMISNIYGTALRKGIFAPLATEFSWMHDIDFSNKYWQIANEKMTGKPMSAEQTAIVDQYTKSRLIGIELQRMDGLAFYRFSAEDANIPIRISKNPDHPHLVFGWGGIAADMKGARDEQGWAPWYYFMRYANTDNVPEAENLKYRFAKTPIPAKTDKDSFIDVTEKPYGAVGDGINDDTSAINQAMAEASARGGGTVYLPQGKYKITSPIAIPSGVELRGPYAAGKRRAYSEGCTLEAYCGKDTLSPETDTAFITLNGDSGIRGFTIAYPEQSYDVTKLHQYPYTIRGNGSGAWVVDIDMLYTCYGIDLASVRCDDHVVKGVWATALFKGITVGGNSRNGKLEHICFSVGPYGESGRIKSYATPEGNEAIRQFIAKNLICYLFGDCENEQTWGLASFLPNTHFKFFKDKGNGCTDSKFWLSMHDVGKYYNVLAESGQDISLIGYFGSGSGAGKYNWLEIGSEFKGPLKVYAKTIQQVGINHPMDFTSEQVIFYEESNLATGKKIYADNTSSGSYPKNANDRDIRSYWEAPSGSYLEVDLGEIRTITGFGFVSAGMFNDLRENIEEADLHISTDGKTFVKAGTANARPGGAAQNPAYSWTDEVINPESARYLRLFVTKPGASGSIKLSEFKIYGY